MALMARITLVTQPGSRLTKQQMTDGSFETAGTIYNAEAQTIPMTLGQLPKLLDGMRDDQALILGTAAQESNYKLISAKEKAKNVDGVTRTKENFTFADTPSLMLLDIDYKQCPSEISSVDPVQMLERALGTTFGYVRRASTTAGITAPDERFGDIKAIYEYRMPSLAELAVELRPLINDLLGESDAML